MKTIYTIGYSNHTFDDFLNLLKKYGITAIVDVRSSPYSQRNPDFSKEILKKKLLKEGIHYIFMGPELGARRTETNVYTNSVVDFEKVRKSDRFLTGISRVIDGVEKGHIIAIMCSEKNPIECHRTVLVARHLSLANYNIDHILADGAIINQSQIDEELLNKYFENYNQISLFGGADNKESCIVESYRKQNRIVGYELKDDDNEERD